MASTNGNSRSAQMLGPRLAANAPAFRYDPHVVAGLVLLNDLFDLFY